MQRKQPNHGINPCHLITIRSLPARRLYTATSPAPRLLLHSSTEQCCLQSPEKTTRSQCAHKIHEANSSHAYLVIWQSVHVSKPLYTAVTSSPRRLTCMVCACALVARLAWPAVAMCNRPSSHLHPDRLVKATRRCLAVQRSRQPLQPRERCVFRGAPPHRLSAEPRLCRSHATTVRMLSQRRCTTACAAALPCHCRLDPPRRRCHKPVASRHPPVQALVRAIDRVSLRLC